MVKMHNALQHHHNMVKMQHHYNKMREEPHMITIQDLTAEEEAFERLKGQAVKTVTHHDALGLLEIHFEGGASLSVQAHGRCDSSVMVTEPKA